MACPGCSNLFWEPQHYGLEHHPQCPMMQPVIYTAPDAAAQDAALEAAGISRGLAAMVASLGPDEVLVVLVCALCAEKYFVSGPMPVPAGMRAIKMTCPKCHSYSPRMEIINSSFFTP